MELFEFNVLINCREVVVQSLEDFRKGLVAVAVGKNHW